MSAYGDITCHYCGISYYELDSHNCGLVDLTDVIESLRAQLAEKERECERLREAREEAIAFLRNDRYSTRVNNALRALENDDG